MSLLIAFNEINLLDIKMGIVMAYMYSNRKCIYKRYFSKKNLNLQKRTSFFNVVM